ncbi:M48 family metalloprotease [Ferrovibrio sp.]|uniref:M48 family metalloprotease n=1 Tax=Ferrovibrio sp. TaxID=1917215 RepID=UPI00311FDA29
MIAPHRRSVLGGLCSCGLLGLGGCVTNMANEAPMTAGYRPQSDTDEGGLWYIVDRVERNVERSRYRVRDPDWNTYLTDIVRRLSPDLHADMRVYLLRAPYFNASMAPNGMMQVNSGLLLRAKDEAQLAAVIGHEIGHYTQKHGLARMRDAKARADVGIFLSMGLALAGVGAAGDLANLLLIAGQYSYSREHEREADEIGLQRMAAAGYRPMAASEVWQQLIEEDEADPNRQSPSVLFATHPAQQERMETLKGRAQQISGGDRHADRYRTHISKIRALLLEDELRLRQYDRSLVLLRRLQAETPEDGELIYFEGEVYRLRDGDGDRRLARETYEKALAAGGCPPEAWRALGQIQRKDSQHDAARGSFRRYLELKPEADDRMIIKSYLERSV